MLDASAIPSELCSTTCDPDPNVMHTRQMFSIYPQVGPVQKMRYTGDKEMICAIMVLTPLKDKDRGEMQSP